MDMRDKLFPIFLKETAKNLQVLEDFLQGGAFSLGDPNEMDTAFRAAHTLKGTARLVQVDSVHQIGRRIEGLLERHIATKTRPTAVECEAMALAVGWLRHLLVDLQAGRPGSSTLVADALSALDLAARFPGDTPLVELLDSAAQQRSPHLNDPFAADPELLVDEVEILRSARDPFADDPSFGFGFDLLPDPDESLSKADLVAPTVSTDVNGAPEVDARLDPATLTPSSEAVSASIGEIPFDPFADDSSFLPAPDFIEATPVQSIAASTDPFADDSEFDQIFDEPVLLKVEADAAVKQADQRNDLIDWRLLPNESVSAPRHYVCCCFELSGYRYFLPIEYVREIAEQPKLLPLPLAPAVVSGLINLRGQVMPVIDLSTLAEQPQPTDAVRRLVVVEYQRERLAFLADGIPYLSEEFQGDKIDLPTFMEIHKIKGIDE